MNEAALERLFSGSKKSIILQCTYMLAEGNFELALDGYIL